MRNRTFPQLVADIGGTNARFALIEGATELPSRLKTVSCASYPQITDAIDDYLANLQGPRPQIAAISIATHVDSDFIKMTNHHWSFSVAAVRKTLGFSTLKILNDFTALALAVPTLGVKDYWQLGSGKSIENEAKAIIGPGTGLGVSGLVNTGSYWMPLQGEGGHVTYGPANDMELAVINLLRENFDHISAERLVSGMGLSLLYQSIGLVHGEKLVEISPRQITEMALQKSSVIAEKTIEMFCSVFGNVAGNLALTLGARGGVYIGGGIVPRLGDYFSHSPFRSRFEQHGRFTQYLQQIPTFVIDADNPALRGAAVSLQSEYQSIGFTSDEDE
ncbi:MAG: glucokinase [Gammaproteobacteria bacterium]|nr:glucokinase [Gammaproteobacteria bacterium]